jgi:hypothetical protein
VVWEVLLDDAVPHGWAEEAWATRRIRGMRTLTLHEYEQWRRAERKQPGAGQGLLAERNNPNYLAATAPRVSRGTGAGAAAAAAAVAAAAAAAATLSPQGAATREAAREQQRREQERAAKQSKRAAKAARAAAVAKEHRQHRQLLRALAAEWTFPFPSSLAPRHECPSPKDPPVEEGCARKVSACCVHTQVAKFLCLRLHSLSSVVVFHK